MPAIWRPLRRDRAIGEAASNPYEVALVGIKIIGPPVEIDLPSEIAETSQAHEGAEVVEPDRVPVRLLQ